MYELPSKGENHLQQGVYANGQVEEIVRQSFKTSPEPLKEWLILCQQVRKDVSVDTLKQDHETIAALEKFYDWLRQSHSTLTLDQVKCTICIVI